MNKNLKKVISAIAALAVSASSIVAFAAGYPDVPETASYKQAVTELTALGIVEGTDNGTFEPDQNVTRAQIAKMIVAGEGGSTMSSAEAQKGKDTKFADVTGSHWASGFISVATAEGTKFVDGYSDTEFGPEDNVTFAQAIKMIVSALGYSTYAENEGGWPGGYLNYGYSLGIANGVTASNDTELTRAQVAQMIDNAIKAPICIIDGWKQEFDGEKLAQVPNRVRKDKASTTVKDQWQCYLNTAHDAYVFNGRVKETHQSNPSLDTDKVKFTVEKADNFEGYQVVKGLNAVRDNANATETAYIGDSEADKNLLTYAEILVQLNDDDEYTILSITPVGSNKVATFNADDYSKATTVASTDDKGTLYSYVDDNSTKTDSFKIDVKKMYAGTEGGFYVNGKQVDLSATAGETLEDKLNAFVKGNATGTVTLIDSPSTGTTSTDGVYDYVMVTYYKDAVVASVVGDAEESTIRFSDRAPEVGLSLDVDTTDDSMFYSFKTVDGKDVAVTDLKENDILSIAWDVTASSFEDSKSYDVLVSTATAEGKLTGKKGTDSSTKYTVGGEVYKTAGTWVSTLNQGNEYTLYLDAFGRIASFEETSASKKYAVLDSVYDNGGGNYYATIITPDGKKEKYPVANDKYQTYLDYTYNAAGAHVTSGEAIKSNRKEVENRVVTYSVTSSGNLNVKENPAADKDTTNGSVLTATYKESTKKLGGIKLSDTLTSALYLGSEYVSEDKVATMAIDAFEDENAYEAYAFNKLSDGSYQFVIVKSGNDSISYKTDFVLYSSSYTTSDEDVDDRTAILVADGDGTALKELLLDEGVSVSGLKEGTPIMVKKNTSGYVTNIYPLFTNGTEDTDGDGDADAVSLDQGYHRFADAARTAIKDQSYEKILNVTNLNTYVKSKSTTNPGGLVTPSSNPVDWVFGAVYETSKNSISIAKKFVNATNVNVSGETSDYTTNVEDDAFVEEFDLDADAKVVVYDYKKKADSDVRAYNGIISAALTLSPVKTDFFDADQDTILNWIGGSFDVARESETYGRTSFALLKLVDGNVAEAFIINPSTSRN